MTTNQPRPRLKSLTPAPDQPSTAEPAEPPIGRSAPKVPARQGVLSSLRPDPQADDGRAPEAVGRDDVLALVEAHTAHRDTCPLRNPAPERRQAA